MITVYAEKFDVGSKIAAALSDTGFDVDGIKVTTSNIESVKEKIKKTCKTKGYIEINYKGEQMSVTWGEGHLCTLKQAKDYNEEYGNWRQMPVPFYPETFEIKVNDQIDRETGKSTGQPDPRALRQLNIVKNLFERSEYIINATDDDREGELIFSYVYQWCETSTPYKRVILMSQTKEGYRTAFDNLVSSDKVKSIENAGRGRAIADWVVGANLTALMSLKYGASSIISIGRVQTPTLNILVKRENEIKNFKSHPYWTLKANFTTADGQTYAAKHKAGQIEDKTKADELLNKVKGKPGIIKDCTSETSSKEAPLLYNLTSLSMDANEKYGITAARTLEIAQDLYTNGYLTYPRTSSQFLTDDMKSTVDDILDMLTGIDKYKCWIDSVSKEERHYTKRHFDSSKVESHFAIIPTNIKPEKLTTEQEQIYDLCAKSLIRIIFKPAVVEKTVIITMVEDEEFNSSGTVIKDAQWMNVDAMPKSENILPTVAKDESVVGDYSLNEGKTKPPERYTDKSLMAALRNAGKDIEDDDLKNIMKENGDGGIGTEATRASIIETVLTRHYAERKNKQIIPTESGMKLIEILPVNDLKSPELTAKFEMKLNKIAKNEYDLNSFISEIENITTQWCNTIKEADSSVKIGTDKNLLNYYCPVCGKQMKKYSWGWACSGYTKENASCKFAISNNICGHEMKETDMKALVVDKKTKYFTDFKKKDGSAFGAFLIVDDSGQIKLSWNVGFDCPCCGKPLIMSSFGWSCSGYKDGCKFSVSNVIAGKTLSDKDKSDLISKGKTKLIKGFTSKAGKTFDAFLKRDGEKIVFEFEQKNK